MNLLRCMTLAMFPKDTPSSLREGSIIYFAISALILLISTAIFPLHKRISLLKHYHEKANAHEEGLVPKDMARKLWSVLKETLGMSIGLSMIYICTFIVFPGTTNHTTLSFITSPAWLNVFFVTLFNVLDTIGRTMGGIKAFFIPTKLIFVLTYLRFIFCVTFVAIANKWSPISIFGSDWFKILNFSLFAFTNGYLQTMYCIFSPKKLSPEKQAVSGILVGIMLSAGVTIGSILELGMSKLIKD